VVNIASSLADFFGGINGDEHGGSEFHILDIIKLFLILGIALYHKSLHLAVLLSYSFFDELLD